MLKDSLAGEHRHVILRKINASFENSNELNQLLLDRLQAARKSAFELLRCYFRLVKRLRVNQVANSFGLGEINAAVEEGPHGELAGFRETCSCGKRKLNDMAQNNWRSVRRNLDDVVGGVGVRPGEVGDDNFVDSVLV